MAHTKSGGKTRQKTTRPGKRLGVKTGQGTSVSSGNIIVRQRGTKIHAGQGVKMGKDFTLFSVTTGRINFKQRRGKKIVEVINQ